METYATVEAPANALPALKADVMQRLATLEATAWWEGRVTTNVLTERFGISRGQASKDFGVYQKLAPANLVYDLGQRGYTPSAQFTPRFMQGTAEEYLQLVQAGQALGNSVALPVLPARVSLAFVQPPARKLDMKVLRVLHQAIRDRRELTVLYQSMSNDARELVLAPHTLVFNGFRWHVRAYSHLHQEFRDFLLARMVSLPRLTGKASQECADDLAWQTMETLCIKPNPRLSPAQQEVIAEDYGMHDGCLLLTVRKALSFYYVRMLGLEPESNDSAKNQLVLSGRISPAELLVRR